MYRRGTSCGHCRLTRTRSRIQLVRRSGVSSVLDPVETAVALAAGLAAVSGEVAVTVALAAELAAGLAVVGQGRAE